MNTDLKNFVLPIARAVSATLFLCSAWPLSRSRTAWSKTPAMRSN
ncbi:hypothetical protein [Acidovorax sp. ST3]|nr:hypothetical protein [Acidovorax sp. ST3]